MTLVILMEKWRYCYHCMDRTWFEKIGGVWYCETCGNKYGEKE